ncbi:hypothetical protein HK103_001990, partial [Boothiomyces macroporosus]
FSGLCTAFVESNTTLTALNTIPDQRCPPPRENWTNCVYGCVERDCGGEQKGVCGCAQWKEIITKPITCQQPAFGYCVGGATAIRGACVLGLFVPIVDGACATAIIASTAAQAACVAEFCHQ